MRCNKGLHWTGWTRFAVYCCLEPPAVRSKIATFGLFVNLNHWCRNWVAIFWCSLESCFAWLSYCVQFVLDSTGCFKDEISSVKNNKCNAAMNIFVVLVVVVQVLLLLSLVLLLFSFDLHSWMLKKSILMTLPDDFSPSWCFVHYNRPYANMRRRLSVTQGALDELGGPAAMEPPCPTVSNVDVKIVGGVWHSSSLPGCWRQRDSPHCMW